MKNFTLIAFLTVIIFAAKAQNVGVGTNTPTNKLDVSGSLRLRETTYPVAGANPAITIANDVSQAQLTSGASPTGTATITTTTPQEGQQLAVYNNSGIPATLNGQNIPTGRAASFIYSATGWRSISDPNLDWKLTGNAGTTATANFIGTTDANDFVVRAGNSATPERMRFLNGASTIVVGPGEGLTNASGLPTIIRGAAFTGTNEPGRRLTIQASNGTGAGGSGIIAFETASASTAGTTPNIMTERMRILNNGQIGVNVTSITQDYSGSGAGWRSFEIRGVTGTATTGAGLLQLSTAADDADATQVGQYSFVDRHNTSNAPNTDRTVAQIVGYTSGTTANKRGGSLVFSTKPDGDFYATERMRILNNGNVGIGTTAVNTTAQLTVAGSGTGYARIGAFGLNYTALSLNGDNAQYNVLSSPTDLNLYLNRPTGFGIFFRVNNAEQMQLSSAGNLGIGTTSASFRLQTNGDIGVGLNIASAPGAYPGYGNSLNFLGGPGASTNFSDNSDQLWLSRFNVSTDVSELRVNIGDNPTNSAQSDAFVIGSTDGSGYVPALTVRSTGLTQIQKIAHTAGSDNYSLELFSPNSGGTEISMRFHKSSSFYHQIRCRSGLFRFTAGNTDTGIDIFALGFVTTSDARVKTNKSALNYGLNEIMKLMPMRYNQHAFSFNENKLELLEDSKNDIGLIAQDVYQLMPEAVLKPEDENKEAWSLNYPKLIPVLIKAIQEQQSQIDNLQTQNKKLETQLNQVDALKVKLEKLESYIYSEAKK
jgi:hypothetical protein